MEAAQSSETMIPYHITPSSIPICLHPHPEDGGIMLLRNVDEDGGSIVLQNAGILTHHYTMSKIQKTAT
jgi:hypothetical protein